MSEVKRYSVIIIAIAVFAAVLWFYDFGPAPAPDSALPADSGILPGDFTTIDIFGNEVGSDIFADYSLTMFYVWTTY